MTLLQLIIFHNFLSHILYTDSIFNVNPKLVWFSKKKKKKNFFSLPFIPKTLSHCKKQFMFIMENLENTEKKTLKSLH